MIKNLVLKELKNNLKGTIILTLSVAIYIVISIVMYSIVKEEMGKVTDFYSIMPEFFRIAFNFNFDHWTSILGFYVAYFVFYIPVAVGCY